jgi:hypothetical protein
LGGRTRAQIRADQSLAADLRRRIDDVAVGIEHLSEGLVAGSASLQQRRGPRNEWLELCGTCVQSFVDRLVER